MATQEAAIDSSSEAVASTENFDTVVIGGGQAGLAVGYYLKKRGRSFFVQQPRDVWIARLREVGVPCEPVFAPGEALSDPHLHEIGLAVPRTGLVVHDCP